jgi:hypothetical protein
MIVTQRSVIQHMNLLHHDNALRSSWRGPQARGNPDDLMDCHVAALLAMTV